MPYDLERFVVEQRPVMDGVRRELQRGRKTGHWMWYVFPQIAGLGSSAMSRAFAIGSLDEARAYLDHPVLGARIRECGSILMTISGRSALDVFGPIDAIKLRSSMTLFHRAAPDDRVFTAVLDRYFDGIPDSATDAILGRLP